MKAENLVSAAGKSGLKWPNIDADNKGV